MKEICAGFQDQLPPDVMTNDINSHFLYMCRELLRFIDQHEKLVRNVLDSNMVPLLLASLSKNTMYDVLRVLHQMDSTKPMCSKQIEGIAVLQQCPVRASGEYAGVTTQQFSTNPKFSKMRLTFCPY